MISDVHDTILMEFDINSGKWLKMIAANNTLLK